MFNLPLTRLLVGLPVLFAANTQASASVEVESELRSIHDSQISAHAIGEGSVLDSLSTADFQFTNQAGEWLDRAQYLDIGRGRQIDAVVSDHDVRIRRFGSVAVVNGVFEAKAGSDSLRRVRYTTVYHWNGDAWRLVNAQDTALREGVSRQQRTGSVPAHAAWQGEDPAGDDLEVLRQLNENYVRAFREADVAWYDAHLTADFVVVNSDGSFDDRAEALTSFAQPYFATHLRTFPVDKVQIRRYDDIALIRAENDYELKDGRKGVNRYTDIWRKTQDGHWKCLAAHITTYRAPGQVVAPAPKP